LPDLKTVNGVATIGGSKGAWFKGSEGNLLALGQFTAWPNTTNVTNTP
jgi:hypothetical protein